MAGKLYSVSHVGFVGKITVVGKISGAAGGGGKLDICDSILAFAAITAACKSGAMSVFFAAEFCGLFDLERDDADDADDDADEFKERLLPLF